jgi:transcriptional regulator with XRE-family HTH domain
MHTEGWRAYISRIGSHSQNGDHALDLALRFGRNLERWRSERGMSLESLAAGAEIDLSEVEKLAEGRGGLPDIDILVRLAGTLDVAPEALLEGFEGSE